MSLIISSFLFLSSESERVFILSKILYFLSILLSHFFRPYNDEKIFLKQLHGFLAGFKRLITSL